MTVPKSVPTRRQLLQLFAGAVALAGTSTRLTSAAFGQGSAKAAGGQAPATIDPVYLRDGMKGYGLTVVKGTKVERFSVEFIGVLQNALPKQDIILIRCAGLNLEHSGVVAGMSGSPIFISDPVKGDLLMGALSYGFPFNKDPVAGVTPIKDMLPELDRKLVPMPTNQRLLPGKKQAALRFVGPQGNEMAPVAIPLSLSGFHPDFVEHMRGPLAELGFPHVQLAAGGTGSGLTKPAPSPPFEPGSAISLWLVRGDMAVSGIGTVTWVRGDKFIAFGHPFKGLGQAHLPIGNANIQWILSSLSSSFKMGNALDDLGTLDQDRQPAIAGRIGPRCDLIPVHVSVTSRDRGDTSVWDCEIVDQPTFFPLAATMVIGNAVRVAEPIAENVAMTCKIKFSLEGGRAPIEIEEMVTGLNGMASVGEVNNIVSGVAKALVYNGFERLRVSRIDASFEVWDERNIVFLDSVRTASEEVEVGKPIEINVNFTRANAPPSSIKLTLPPLPKELAGANLTVQIGPEKNMMPEQPEPATIDDMLKFLRSQIPRNRLAAVIALPEPTLMLKGARLVGLPIGVRDEIGGHQVSYRNGKDTLRVTTDLPWTINGNASLKLRVRNLA